MQRTSQYVDLNKAISTLLILIGCLGLVFVAVTAFQDVAGPTKLSANQIALGLFGATLLTSGLLIITRFEIRKLLMWPVVLEAVIVALFSADLILGASLPSPAIKLALIATVGCAILLSRRALSDPTISVSIADWKSVSAPDRTTVSKFSLLLLQLGLIVLVMGIFRLENQALYHNLMLVALFGFFFNFLLPHHYKLPFFLLTSLATILGLFGMDGGIWMILIGLILIGLCNIPIHFRYRITLIILFATVLILLRANVIPSPIPEAIWPILGSMFMFRTMVYLYDLSHQKEGARSPLFSLAYFFLLPNLVFPLFPVVDYANFYKKFYDKEQFQIYQTGVRWIYYGVLQLIAYRFINYYLVISPQEVANVGDLVHFLAANFLLIVRITGQFHIAVGLLLLFGFNLPVANNRYLLATSFTDFWRRANIYWKDFMQKVFYYPSYFGLRSMGEMSRLVLATLFVFLITWAFHSYQWFWLRGSLLLSIPDILYWFLLGILILANLIVEVRRGRKRSLGKPAWSFRETALLSLKALGVFSVICILWGLWTSPSVEEYIGLWSAAFSPLESIADLAPIAVIVVALIGAKFWYTWRGEEDQNQLKEDKVYFRTASVTSLSIFCLAALGTPFVQSRLDGPVGTVASSLTVSRLSDRDAELLLRGYYEDLVGINRFNTELWEIYNKRPTDWPTIQETEAGRLTQDIQIIDLTPSVSLQFHGAQFTTNQWGMRDKEYSLFAPEGAYRLALIGPSFVMGSGVNDHETFEWILEERLNDELTGNGISQFEILNFGVAGYSVIQEMNILDTEVLNFQPDALLIVSHQAEMETLVRNLASNIADGIEIPYDFIEEISEEAGVTPGMPRGEIERRLQPFQEEILQKSYNHVSGVARDLGIPAVWVFMLTPNPANPDENIDRLFELAEEAEFLIVDLKDLYEGHDVDELIVAEWDRHPNAIAHQMIADQLFERIFESGLLQPDGA